MCMWHKIDRAKGLQVTRKTRSWAIFLIRWIWYISRLRRREKLAPLGEGAGERVYIWCREITLPEYVIYKDAARMCTKRASIPGRGGKCPELACCQPWHCGCRWWQRSGARPIFLHVYLPSLCAFAHSWSRGFDMRCLWVSSAPFYLAVPSAFLRGRFARDIGMLSVQVKVIFELKTFAWSPALFFIFYFGLSVFRVECLSLNFSHLDNTVPFVSHYCVFRFTRS